ncbi:MAG TPA: alpha,alpha-trehalase TreF [Rhodanobacteraceae bacterium]|nr:alpha,alpha-trehalase TreF [Rhodanobacteraceae bacterium]
MNAVNDPAHTEEAIAKAAEVAQADTLNPADRYEELFVAVQTGRVFDDSKTFVDCAPLQPPTKILQAYREQCKGEGFDLKAFVHAHFKPEKPHLSDYVSDPDRPMREHIDKLWDALTRQPRQHPEMSSLLPLPYDYVVPGGRFGEIYYWDSYFTMLGLAESGRPQLLRAMADNFAYLIDTYGHVPNGNRTYYLSRSQPPLFPLMVELFEHHRVHRAVEYLPQLRKEYTYWMAGCEDLGHCEVAERCVRMSDGTVLNRYWDDRETPREESYLEDVTTARQTSRPNHEVYRDLRAGCASGWDFSSRWLDEGQGLASIRTTAIVPVDLNCFLHKMESQIAWLSRKVGDDIAGENFEKKARARKQAIDTLLWNDKAGAFFDYDWQREKQRSNLTAATAAPLFANVASPEQAHRTAQCMRERLLDEGGIATSEHDSDEQWDQPNGWAPLQWMAMCGLMAYDEAALAHDIANRWLETVSSLYEREGKLVEKYRLQKKAEGSVGGGGGEYPLQDGFGWTNGVTRKLLHDDPKHAANDCRAKARKRRL